MILAEELARAEGILLSGLQPMLTCRTLEALQMEYLHTCIDHLSFKMLPSAHTVSTCDLAFIMRSEALMLPWHTAHTQPNNLFWERRKRDSAMME